MSMESLESEISDQGQIKREALEKEEIILLRRELHKIKEKTSEEVEKNKKSCFFGGLEILDVNLGELTDDDALLFKDLKEFIRKKIPFEEFFKELSLHRLLIGRHMEDMLEKNPNFDFRKDSRTAFSAWVVNRAMNEYAKKAKEKKDKKAA